jgi:hypothetical protein
MKEALEALWASSGEATSQSSPRDERLSWMRQQPDWLDPFVERRPSILARKTRAFSERILSGTGIGALGSAFEEAQKRRGEQNGRARNCEFTHCYEAALIWHCLGTRSAGAALTAQSPT